MVKKKDNSAAKQKTSKAKKTTKEPKADPFANYTAPYITPDAENAMKAYRRIGFVDGVSSAEDGCEYTVLIANKDNGLAITNQLITYNDGVFTAANGMRIPMNWIVAIKKF